MKFKVYKRKGWRWQLKAANNKIVAASSESFDSKRNAIDNAMLTGKELQAACEEATAGH